VDGDGPGPPDVDPEPLPEVPLEPPEFESSLPEPFFPEPPPPESSVPETVDPEPDDVDVHVGSSRCSGSEHRSPWSSAVPGLSMISFDLPASWLTSWNSMPGDELAGASPHDEIR
jgi:hypothetical protein